MSLAVVKKAGQKLVSLCQRLTRRARLRQIREILYTEYCNTFFSLFFVSEDRLVFGSRTVVVTLVSQGVIGAEMVDNL